MTCSEQTAPADALTRAADPCTLGGILLVKKEVMIRTKGGAFMADKYFVFYNNS